MIKVLSSAMTLVLVLSSAGLAVADDTSDLQVAREAEERSDYAAEERLLRPLAEQGNADAQFMLASLYFNGEGAAERYDEAVSWYLKAADRGNARAQEKLGLIYREGLRVPHDYVQAHKWLSLSAAREKPGVAHLRVAQELRTTSTQMTPPQIIEARKLAREWAPAATGK